jgi:hypothetical protein
MHCSSFLARVFIASATLAVACCGCAVGPYTYSRFADAPRRAPVFVERGQPNKTLERIGWVVGLPARIVPLHAKVNNHHISDETLAKLVTYLEQNDLADVRVFVDHYDPKGQWRRLGENQAVNPAWRYSLGTVGWLGYTLLPGRLFGGDTYDPYTNTLQLHSDVPAMVLREAALAKDVHSRIHPGAYCFVSGLPGFSIYRDSQITGEVLGYARERHDWELEREAYHVLYPQFGSQVATLGMPFFSEWWAGPALGLSGAATGHVVGRTVAKRREKEVSPRTSADPAADPAAREQDERQVTPASASAPVVGP